MIFFNTLKDKEKEKRSMITTLAFGTEIKKGKLDTEGEVVVDGHYEGGITAGMGVIIGREGRVEGRVEAKKIILMGEIIGEAYCDEIEVMDGAKIIGEITTGNFIIGNGGIFEGIIKKKSKQRL